MELGCGLWTELSTFLPDQDQLSRFSGSDIPKFDVPDFKSTLIATLNYNLRILDL
jgi:hypothetical protein